MFVDESAAAAAHQFATFGIILVVVVLVLFSFSLKFFFSLFFVSNVFLEASRL
jgi:hypothetical protein